MIRIALFGISLSFASSLAFAAGAIDSAQTAPIPANLVAGTTDLKSADIGVIPFNDNQQINSFKVTIEKSSDGVKLIVTYNVSGNLGAGIKDTTPIQLYLQHQGVVLGISPGMGWLAACHQENPFSATVDVPDVQFDDIDSVSVAALHATDYAC